MAAVDAYGTALNLYTSARRVDRTRPNAPWAVNLADVDGNYRLIGFDLDAKAHDASKDASQLCEILDGTRHPACGLRVRTHERAACLAGADPGRPLPTPSEISRTSHSMSSLPWTSPRSPTPTPAVCAHQEHPTARAAHHVLYAAT